MPLIKDWKRKFPRLWSVRLAVLAGVLSGIEVGFNLYATGSAPVIVVGAMVVSLGAAIARIVAQPRLDEVP